MTRTKFTSLAVLNLMVALLAPAIAWAQAPLSLTLQEAIRMGVGHDPRLSEARALDSAAASTVSSQATLGYPSVTTSAGFLRTNHVPPYGVPTVGGGDQRDLSRRSQQLSGPR